MRKFIALMCVGGWCLTRMLPSRKLCHEGGREDASDTIIGGGGPSSSMGEGMPSMMVDSCRPRALGGDQTGVLLMDLNSGDIPVVGVRKLGFNAADNMRPGPHRRYSRHAMQYVAEGGQLIRPDLLAEGHT